MTVIAIISLLLGLGTIIGQVVIVFLVGLILLKKDLFGIISFVSKHGLLLGFFIALASVVGSLYYSEIAGITPCVLCWWQRIFMYPQVVLLGMASVRNDRKIADYSIFLSIIGAIIAGYQYYLQLGGAPITSCGGGSFGVDCAKITLVEFGYVTIPLMSFTAFLLVIIFAYLSKQEKAVF